jgi:hypothetical protein
MPLKLIELRETGRCDIGIPESLFDLDCPGHGFRRIKAVALSIPCVVGPYASVNAQLTLNESYVRQGGGGYGSNPQDDSTNFVQFRAAVTSVVTSSAQSDSGMFETNLNDGRYLPFEGAGAISTWGLELLGSPHPFDYDTISDVVLTIRYTARPTASGDAAGSSALNWLKANAARVFSMRHEFATEWAVFKGAISTNGEKASLKFSLDKQHFPYRMDSISDRAKQMHLFFAGDATGDAELVRGGETIGTTQLVSGSAIVAAFDPTGDFELRFDSNALEDLWVVIDWSAEQD